MTEVIEVALEAGEIITEKVVIMIDLKEIIIDLKDLNQVQRLAIIVRRKATSLNIVQSLIREEKVEAEAEITKKDAMIPEVEEEIIGLTKVMIEEGMIGEIVMVEEVTAMAEGMTAMIEAEVAVEEMKGKIKIGGIIVTVVKEGTKGVRIVKNID